MCVLGAGRFGETLSLDGLALCGGVSLSCISRAFLGFSLGTLCFGGLAIRQRTGAFRLDRTASGLAAEIAGLFTSTFVTPVTRSAGDERNEQQYHQCAHDNCDDCCCTHGLLLRM